MKYEVSLHDHGKKNRNVDGLFRQAWKEVSVEEDIAGQMSTQELNIVEDDNSLRKGRCGDQILTPGDISH